MPMPEKEDGGYRHNDVGRSIVKCVERLCWIREIIIAANKFNCRGKSPLQERSLVSKERTVLNSDYSIRILSISSMRKTPLVNGDIIG